MRLAHILVAIILALAAYYFVSERGGATEAVQTGDSLSFVFGDHRLEATVTGDEYHDSFLVVGGIRPGDLFFSTLLAVIPMETAEQLAESYGDFRRCGSPGAREAERHTLTMGLYAVDGRVERTLDKINKLALAHKDPIFEMRFAPLTITDHKAIHNGEEIEVRSRSGFEPFLVKEVRLLRKGMDL